MSCVAASEAKDVGMDVAQRGHEARRAQVWVSSMRVPTTAGAWEMHRALKPQVKAQSLFG